MASRQRDFPKLGRLTGDDLDDEAWAQLMRALIVAELHDRGYRQLGHPGTPIRGVPDEELHEVIDLVWDRYATLARRRR